MSHYFSKNQASLESSPRLLPFTFKDHSFTFLSDRGVFSKDHIDYATTLLLNHVDIQKNDYVLDLGCGYGVIGIVLQKVYDVHATLSDINQRALDLAQKNADKHQVNVQIINSEGFEAIDQSFDHIITNPPIRIGKKPLYQLFKTAEKHLNSAGKLWLVIHKKHGAKSAIDYLNTMYRTEVIQKQKGFHVIKCQKH